MQGEYVGKAFTPEEVELLYDACLCYADELTESAKKIRNTPDALDIINHKAKVMYNMASQIVVCGSKTD